MELNILLSRWLSRCILRVTNEEIKLKFRQLEKYKLKNLKAKSHLFFNETCLNIYIYIYLQNFGYIPLFKEVCIKFIPLFRWTHFSVSFSTSRKINLKLYILDKKDIIKQ